jgi:sulfur carrier protein
MELVINGEPRQVSAVQNLAALMDALDVPSKRGVAVAVNDAVVPRGKWADEPIKEGDRVEIIRATQGG